MKKHKNMLIAGYEGQYTDFQKKEAQKIVDSFETEAEVVDGVVKWKMGNFAPKDYMELWLHVGKEFDYEKTMVAYQKDLEETFARYRQQMENHIYSEEELFEMTHAFGEGETVVDIITGQKIKL